MAQIKGNGLTVWIQGDYIYVIGRQAASRDTHLTHNVPTTKINKVVLAVVSSLALFGGAMTLITPEAKANGSASCQNIGSYTSCRGSDGSSYSSQGIGDSYHTFSGTNQYGDRYSGSCQQIGSYTSCRSY